MRKKYRITFRIDEKNFLKYKNLKEKTSLKSSLFFISQFNNTQILFFNYWQRQDKKTLKKINKLLIDIDRNGYQCIGKPEALKGNLSGFWSVRIDEKNRIVFRISEDCLEIAECGSHYRDK